MKLKSLAQLVPFLGLVIRYKKAWPNEGELKKHMWHKKYSGWTYGVVSPKLCKYGGPDTFGVSIDTENRGFDGYDSITERDVQTGVIVELVPTEDWIDRHFSYNLLPWSIIKPSVNSARFVPSSISRIEGDLEHIIVRGSINRDDDVLVESIDFTIPSGFPHDLRLKEFNGQWCAVSVITGWGYRPNITFSKAFFSLPEKLVRSNQSFTHYVLLHIYTHTDKLAALAEKHIAEQSISNYDIVVDHNQGDLRATVYTSRKNARILAKSTHFVKSKKLGKNQGFGVAFTTIADLVSLLTQTIPDIQIETADRRLF